MATRYEPKTAEPRQQARWAAADAFSVSNADTGRPTYYVLDENGDVLHTDVGYSTTLGMRLRAL